MSKSKNFLGLLTLCFVMASVFVLGGHPLRATAAELPKMMTWTAYDVGSSGYMMAGFIGESLWEKYKIKVRIIPAGTDLPRVFPLRLKDADFAFHGVGSYFMQEGMFDYSNMEWGPQPVRALYFAQHAGLALGLRGDSDIKTLADLKGKRVAYYPTMSLTLICEAHLAFAGLTWKDVQKVQVPSYVTAMNMVNEGKIDTAHINPTASKAYEFEAMPQGLRFIPVPRSDKAGWARVKKLAPMYSPMNCKIGAGLPKDKPLETITQAYPIVIAYNFTSADKVYTMTKLLHEAFPVYSQKHKSLAAYWPMETALELYDEYPLPLHEGAIRYLKEIGKWTPEREAKNNQYLKRQKDLRKLFDKVKAQATEKKMTPKDFPKFWLEKRAAAGF
ncbi:MAG: TAXI family TRAP transporter solute-binding subunit [Deltaproteobacteria bacterium]|jgi:TRAP transporter TAXI family solute receptor|nr:TAXI family TRAP transporter solute-binding subunit [Deltaproteobacteria bacterium]